MSIISNTAIGKFAKNLDIDYLTHIGFIQSNGNAVYYKGNKNKYVYKTGTHDEYGFLYYIDIPSYDADTWAKSQTQNRKHYKVYIKTKYGIDMLVNMFNSMNQKNRIKLKKRFIKELRPVGNNNYEI